MNVLVDMNLSPSWVPALGAHGHVARHWSTVADPRAPDTVIMAAMIVLTLSDGDLTAHLAACWLMWTPALATAPVMLALGGSAAARPPAGAGASLRGMLVLRER